MSEMRTYWLSFVDGDRPEGERFLGVALIEVTETEADAIYPEVAARFPQHQPGAEWLAAASRKAWQTGCNPGGEIASFQLPADKLEEMAQVPRNRLLSKADLLDCGIGIEPVAKAGTDER